MFGYALQLYRNGISVRRYGAGRVTAIVPKFNYEESYQISLARSACSRLRRSRLTSRHPAWDAGLWLIVIFTWSRWPCATRATSDTSRPWTDWWYCRTRATRKGLKQAVGNMRLFKEFLEAQPPAVFDQGMQIFTEHTNRIAANFKGED